MMRHVKLFEHLNEGTAPGKNIWIGIMPGAFGYGISVAELTEEACTEALRRAFNDWIKKEGTVPAYMKTFEDAMEYFGGRVSEIVLGKQYYDDFGE